MKVPSESHESPMGAIKSHGSPMEVQGAPRKSLGTYNEFPWDLHVIRMGIPWDVHVNSMGLQCFYGTSVGYPWDFHGDSMGLPWDFHVVVVSRWDFHGPSMGLSWDFHRNTALPWGFRGTLKEPHGIAMGLS